MELISRVRYVYYTIEAIGYLILSCLYVNGNISCSLVFVSLLFTFVLFTSALILAIVFCNVLHNLLKQRDSSV